MPEGQDDLQWHFTVEASSPKSAEAIVRSSDQYRPEHIVETIGKVQ
jgi:hypothetical protein